jgi:hypothetical protein
MSEACKGLDPTPASDIYSLGCSLFQVLTGNPVYAGTSALVVMQEHIASPVPRIEKTRPDLASLQPLIERTLAKDPQARWSEARLFAKALQGASVQVSPTAIAGRVAVAPVAVDGKTAITSPGATAVEQPEATVATAARPGRRPSRVPLAAAAVGALALVAVVASAWPHGGKAPAAALAGPAAGPETGPSVSQAAAAPAAVARAEPPVSATLEDLAKLDAAERALQQGQLEQAQADLRGLIVAGDAKARLHAIQGRIDQAWRDRRDQLTKGLDQAEAQIGTDPGQATAALQRLEVPDRFPDLADRRTKLLEKARAQPARSADQPRSGPSGSTPAGAASGDTRAVVLGANEVLGGVRRLGDRAVPGGLPLGELTMRMSMAWRDKTTSIDRGHILMKVPAGSGAARDTLQVLVHGTRARDLHVWLLEEGQPWHEVTQLHLSGREWEALSIPLDGRAKLKREVVLSSDEAADAYFLAAAAYTPGRAATWDDFRFAATATLSPPLPNGGTGPIYELAWQVRNERAAASLEKPFPQFEQVRLGVPDGFFHSDVDKQERVLSALKRFEFAPGQTGEAPSRAGTVMDYSVDNAIAFLLHRAAGEHGTGNFYLHYVATNHPPDLKVEELAKQLLDATHGKAAIMPVLVFGARAWEGDLRTQWSATIAKLRERAPGVPVIDLALVPIATAHAGGKVDIHSPEAQDAIWGGFEAGLRELRERIDVATH